MALSEADKAERGAGKPWPRDASRLCDITVAVMFVLFVIAMFTGVV